MKDEISKEVREKIAKMKARQQPQSDYVRERLERIKRNFLNKGE